MRCVSAADILLLSTVIALLLEPLPRRGKAEKISNSN
jgi:hypothetical protein